MDALALSVGQNICQAMNSANAHYLVLKSCGAFGEGTLEVGYVAIIGAAAIVLGGIGQALRRK